MKILVVDDHQLIREGLRPVMKQIADPPEEVEVLEAATFAAGLDVARRHPDLELVLLDLHLPDVEGFEALAGFQSAFPAVPVIVVSGADEPALVRQAVDHGALGFIPKSSSSAVIVNAIRLVLSGGTYLPRQIMDAPATTPREGAPRATGMDALGLTPRQADVLRLLLAGKSNKVICRELDLAEGTVKNHLAAIFRALDVSTRVEAIVAAARLGIRT
jgi:DNA-binding NarL/FixJ family response regulator